MDFSNSDNFSTSAFGDDEKQTIMMGDDEKNIEIILTPNQVKNLFSLIHGLYSYYVELGKIEPYDDIRY